MNLLDKLSAYFLTDLEVIIECPPEAPLKVVLDASSGAILAEKGAARVRYVFFGGWLPTRATIVIEDARGATLTLRRGRVGKVDASIAPKDGRPFLRTHFLSIGDSVAIHDLAGRPVVVRRFRHRDYSHVS